MPLTLSDLTPEELEEYSRKTGIDHTQFDIRDNQFVLKQPTSPDPNETVNAKTSTARGAFGRSASVNVAPVLAGGLAAVGAGAALSATGAGLPAGIPLILSGLAGLGAGYATQKAQEPLLTENFKQQLAADAEQHPVASALGGAAPNLLLARPTSIPQLIKAGRGFTGSIDPTARAAARGLAANIGINTGVGIGQRAIEGRETSVGDVAQDVALGGLLAGRGWNNPITRGIDRIAKPLARGKPFEGASSQQSAEDELASRVREAQQDSEPVNKPVDSPEELLKNEAEEIKAFEEKREPNPEKTNEELVNAAADNLSIFEHEKPLTRGFLKVIKEHFGPIQGTEILEKDLGSEIQGSYQDNDVATITPEATQATGFHEVIGHGFVEKGLASEDKALKSHLNRILEIAPEDKSYQSWRAEAESAGIDPAPKEYLAQLLGEKLAVDFSGNRYLNKSSGQIKYQLELLKKDFRRLFKTADVNDLADLVQEAAVYGKGRELVGIKPETEGEEFSNINAPEISALRSIAKDSGGRYLTEKMIDGIREKTQLLGKFRNGFLDTIQKTPDAKEQYLKMIEQRHGGPVINTPFTKAIRALQVEGHNEQRANGPNVREYDSDGSVSFRPPKDDPNWVPEKGKAEVYQILSEKPESPEAVAYRKDFLDWNDKLYPGHPEIGVEKLKQMFPRKGGSPKVDYNAVRLEEGSGLPPSWRETDPIKVYRYYASHLAGDLAFYRNLQKDPAIRQLLNINSDGKTAVAPKGDKLPTGETIAGVDYSNNPHVNAALQDFIGGKDLLPIEVSAVNRLVKAFMLGIPTKIRDIVASPFIAMEVGGFGTLAKLPEAVRDISNGITQAIKRGHIDLGRDNWFDDTLSTATTLTEKLNAITDKAVKFQGLDKLEAFTRGLTWNLGKLIGESKLTDSAFLDAWGPKNWKTLKAAGKFDEITHFIADRAVDTVQGTYDFRGAPTWMRNSALGSIFALNKWSAERMNNFRENVITPAKNGNLKPLLTAAFATVLGSAAIEQVNELITGKKPDNLTWSEWLALDDLGLKENLYKLAAAVSTSGTTGLYGDVLASAYKVSQKPGENQNFGVPVLNAAETLVKRIGQFADTETFDLPQFVNTVATDNLSTYRALAGHFDEDKNPRRDYRVYERLQGKAPENFETNPFEPKDKDKTYQDLIDENRDRLSRGQKPRPLGPVKQAPVYDAQNPGSYKKFLETIGEDPQERFALEQTRKLRKTQ